MRWITLATKIGVPAAIGNYAAMETPDDWGLGGGDDRREALRQRRETQQAAIDAFLAEN